MRRVVSVALAVAALGAVAGCSGSLDYDESAYLVATDSDAGAPPPVTGPPEVDGAVGPSPSPPPPPPPMAKRDGGGGDSPQAPAGCAPGLDALSILAAKCGTCHGEVSPTKGLDLVTPGVAKRLVGIQSTCYSRAFLDLKAGPVSGYFLDKLEGPVENCGEIMPFAAPPLSADEKSCLVEWAGRAVARVPVVEN
jgi:hypothetical protein